MDGWSQGVEDEKKEDEEKDEALVVLVGVALIL